MTDRNSTRQERSESCDTDRRAWMTGLARPLALAFPISIWADRGLAAVGVTEIEPSPPGETPTAFMAQAERMRDLALDAGDQGYGAVIVKDGRIVGHAPSRVVVNRDPTAHAEMEAIRDAARNLGARDLGGCTLYGTSRACPMCEAAAYWANIESMRYGASVADAGAPQLRRC